MAAIVVLCAVTRSKFSLQEREKRDEVDYGMAPPACVFSLWLVFFEKPHRRRRKLMFPVAV